MYIYEIYKNKLMNIKKPYEHKKKLLHCIPLNSNLNPGCIVSVFRCEGISKTDSSLIATSHTCTYARWTAERRF